MREIIQRAFCFPTCTRDYLLWSHFHVDETGSPPCASRMKRTMLFVCIQETEFGRRASFVWCNLFCAVEGCQTQPQHCKFQPLKQDFFHAPGCAHALSLCTEDVSWSNRSFCNLQPCRRDQAPQPAPLCDNVVVVVEPLHLFFCF